MSTHLFIAKDERNLIAMRQFFAMDPKGNESRRVVVDKRCSGAHLDVIRLAGCVVNREIKRP